MLKEQVDLIKKIPIEVDVDTLRDILGKEYANADNKIRSFVRNGVLLRVRSGWYVLSEPFRSRPVFLEYLANVIYMPSYISMDYALSFHGFIPERVETITSVTTKNTKIIDTPLGRFSYKKISRDAFRTGRDLFASEGKQSFFIATPEKALADKVQFDISIEEIYEIGLMEYLVENLRIEQESLAGLSTSGLWEAARAYKSRKITSLAHFIEKLQMEDKS